MIDTDHQVSLPAMIIMFSGLKLDEVFALQWDNMDFNNNTITVNKSVVFQNNKGIIINGGKIKNATRIVAVSPILVDSFKKEKLKSGYKIDYSS